jgi:hypothetical protein
MPELLALSFNPFSGTVRAFSHRGGLLRPLLTSAPWSGDLAAASVRRHCLRTRHRSPGVSPASFPAHPPDLQSRPLMDMDFATSCPLVRPLLPRIRLLFVGSRVRSTLPSDGPSRFRPCASLVLHLHQVAQGTFTPRTLDMPSTQTAARRLRRWPAASLDRGSARSPSRLRPGRESDPSAEPKSRRRLPRTTHALQTRTSLRAPDTLNMRPLDEDGGTNASALAWLTALAWQDGTAGTQRLKAFEREDVGREIGSLRRTASCVGHHLRMAVCLWQPPMIRMSWLAYSRFR